MGLEGCWGGPEVAAEPAGGVPGLFLGRGFLGAEEQAQLVARAGELCSAPGRTGGASPGAPNQAMRFAGSTGLPPWADDLAELVSEFLLHGGVVTRGAPLRFNQMIVNRYSPGQGISAHVDLAVFGDVVASVSLESAAMMDFSPKGGGGQGERAFRTRGPSRTLRASPLGLAARHLSLPLSAHLDISEDAGEGGPACLNRARVTSAGRGGGGGGGRAAHIPYTTTAHKRPLCLFIAFRTFREQHLALLVTAPLR